MKRIRVLCGKRKQLEYTASTSRDIHKITAHSSLIRDCNVVGGGKNKGPLKHKIPSSFFHSLIFAVVYACFQLLFVQ